MKQTSFLLTHFSPAIIITGIVLLIYASVQQAHRSSANDPQLQIARDLGNAISSGKSTNNLLSADTIDLTQSLAVFTALFNKQGNPMQSTGLLNGKLPQLPQGVFQFTNTNLEDVITWQPQPNVRMAMVIEKVNSSDVGFVAVGRSLKEVEIRESNLVKMAAIVLVICLALLCIHFLVQNFLAAKNKN